MTGIFVTATGTDIGKTFVTAGLVRALRREGRAVEALKPVLSGFDAAAAGRSDSAILLAAMGVAPNSANIARITPWRFAAPLSPDMAARKEGRSLDVDAIVDFCRRRVAAANDVILIEGVGGVMVPLTDDRTVLDWIAALALPAILVTGSYLGTISHTLTALEVLRRQRTPVLAVVVNETPGSGVALSDTVDSIRRFAGDAPVLALPFMADGEDETDAFSALARLV